MMRNPILYTDAYNLSHQALKQNTDWEVSHVYNRKAGMVLYGFHEAVSTLFGTMVITQEMVDEAIRLTQERNLVFPRALFQRLVDELGGRIPLEVLCVPEGEYYPAGTPFAQIRNTVEGFGELVTWWEGLILHTYFSSSCATEAFHLRQYLNGVASRYRGVPDGLARVHSFGFRGHRSVQDAYWAGMAWTLFFRGSDDLHIVQHTPPEAFTSIIALAHKVVQQFDDEMECFVHAIDQAHLAKKHTVALVIDTYDANNVIKTMVRPLAEYAAARDVHVVFRPDSGDLYKQCVDICDIVKEHNITNVSVLIGEGMSLQEIQKADLFFLKNNVPLQFVAYGVGAGFYKHLERDTLGWAMKTAFSNGKPRMKFSENPMKRSIPGRLKVFRVGDRVVVGAEDDEHNSLYQPIYVYGEGTPVDGFATVAARVQGLKQTEQVFVDTTPAIKALVRQFRDRYRK